MTSAQSENSEWGLIDRRTVEFLIERDGAVDVMSKIMGGNLSPQARAAELAKLAVAGKIMPMRGKTEEFKDWAEKQGLRRLANALIELDRVLALKKRGQAILQAQALTRFISQNVDDDIEALRRAVLAKQDAQQN